MLSIIEVDDFLYTFREESTTSDLRLGQAFCNYFNVVDPVVFYEISETKAIKHIYDNYIEL